MEPSAKRCREGSKGLRRHGVQDGICSLKKRAPALAQPCGLDKMSALGYGESNWREECGGNEIQYFGAFRPAGQRDRPGLRTFGREELRRDPPGDRCGPGPRRQHSGCVHVGAPGAFRHRPGAGRAAGPGADPGPFGRPLERRPIRPHQGTGRDPAFLGRSAAPPAHRLHRHRHVPLCGYRRGI